MTDNDHTIEDRQAIAERVRSALDAWVADETVPTMVDLDVYDQHGLSSFRYASLGEMFASIADPEKWNTIAKSQAQGQAMGCDPAPTQT
jgi:hypothetical protein